MSRKSARNGTDHDGERTRPSWYVPIPPIDEDGPTAQELLKRLQVLVEPGDLPNDVRADIKTYLDQFGTPVGRHGSD